MTVQILDEIEDCVLTNRQEDLVNLLKRGPYKLRIYRVISNKFKVYYLV